MLQTAASCHVVQGSEPGSYVRAVVAVNCCATSLNYIIYFPLDFTHDRKDDTLVILSKAYHTQYDGL